MKPLAGVKVLDLTRLLPGPYASMVLADLGADVIRVESPLAPDFLRYVPRLFAHLNRNKRSLELRYDQEEGAELLRKLARGCDVWMESNRPGVMDRLGLGPERLRAEHPGLIYLSLSGYGQTGPLAQRAGHDLNFLARSGLSEALGEQPGGTQLGDFSGGLLAAMAVLAALVKRSTSGEGGHLDVALADGAFSLGLGMWTGTRMPNLSGKSPVYRSYRCQDGGFMAVGALERKFQERLFRALGLEPPGQDLFVQPLPEWHERLEAIFATEPRVHWERIFADADACVEPVLPAGEDDYFRERGLLQGFLSPSFGPAGDGPAPTSGQHTREILAEAGLS